jgi:hypothetical protein
MNTCGSGKYLFSTRLAPAFCGGHKGGIPETFPKERKNRFVFSRCVAGAKTANLPAGQTISRRKAADRTK